MKYSKKFIIMHWVHALLLTFLLIGASLKLPELGKNVDLSAFKMHIILGVIATLLTFVRIFMAIKEPKLVPLYSTDNIKQKMSDWNHKLIYVTLVIVGLSGIATAKISNLGSVVVFGAKKSNFDYNSLSQLFGNIHSASTTVLIALIIMHIAGVVMYKYNTGKNAITRVLF